MLKSKIKKHLPWFILLVVFFLCCLVGLIFAYTMMTPSGHDYSTDDTAGEEQEQQEEQKTGTYYVYGGAHGLPLCDAPSPYSKITTVIPDKSEVTILSSKIRGYYKIQYKSREGYVKNRYLLRYDQKVSEKTKKKLLEDYPLYYIDTKEDTVTLYKRKNESSKVVAEIPGGYRVRVLSTAQNGYYRVSYKNRIGYLNAQYVLQSADTMADQ